MIDLKPISQEKVKRKQIVFFIVVSLAIAGGIIGVQTLYSDFAKFTQKASYSIQAVNNSIHFLRNSFGLKSTTVKEEQAGTTLLPKKGVILFWNSYYLSNFAGLSDKLTVPYDCGQYQCNITKDRKLLNRSAAVIVSARFHSGPLPRLETWQRLILQTAESPVNERVSHVFDGRVNWTFTYHRKSEILYHYGFYIPKGQYDKIPAYVPQDSTSYMSKLKHFVKSVNLTSLKRKEKGVLWFVSNCAAHLRMNYVKQLENNSLTIDKFGACARRDPCGRKNSCILDMVSKYKFYLSFENSRCDDYITEKTWKALQDGMVPIVMGPSVTNYLEKLPPDSFIHVDNFTSAAELVKYVKYLDKNNEAYMKYHKWREEYVAVHGQTLMYLWVCDICKKIHDPPKPAHDNVSNWWKPAAMCR